MVSVEPPERMRPLAASWNAARMSASGSTPVMGAEALVLVGEQHVEEARIDIGDPRRQPPAALGGGIGPQQPAVAVDHAG